MDNNSQINAFEQQKGVRYDVSNHFWSRMLGEFLGDFTLIFIINLGLTLGEVGVDVFEPFYNINFLTGVWIGTWTFVAFLVFRKTTIGSNFVNLVLSIGNKNISNKEFIGSAIFQFIGGMFAAIFVYLICVDIVAPDTIGTRYSMGGTIPGVKDFFLNKPVMWNTDYIWYDPTTFNNALNNNELYKYGFASIQGGVNALAIIVLFFSNRFVDNKYNNGSKALVFRYIILIVSISLTTIMYANTTNYIRILTPAIVDVIANGWRAQEFLTTTLTFIAVQTIGIVVMFFMARKLRD